MAGRGGSALNVRDRRPRHESAGSKLGCETGVPPVLFTRALALACPRCCGRHIFRSWFHLRTNCPTCGLALERGEYSDDWLGGYLFNLIGSELLGIFIVVVVVIGTWPAAPWTVVEILGAGLMIGLPFLLYPI